jgi:hypothetical protein
MPTQVLICLLFCRERPGQLHEHGQQDHEPLEQHHYDELPLSVPADIKASEAEKRPDFVPPNYQANDGGDVDVKVDSEEKEDLTTL